MLRSGDFDVDVEGDSVTLSEWLSNERAMQQKALERFPFKAEACLGGPAFQRAYSCLTCRKDARSEGLLYSEDLFVCCYSCHLKCHPATHKLVEVGARRNFTCRCGPSCSFSGRNFAPANGEFSPPTRKPTSELVEYSVSPQNFDGIFCWCRKFVEQDDEDALDDAEDFARPLNVDAEDETDTLYPVAAADDDDKTDADTMMFQCLACEDWFHWECIRKRSKQVPSSMEDFEEFICGSDACIGAVFPNPSHQQGILRPGEPLFLADGWRSMRCACADCLGMEAEIAKNPPTELLEPPLEDTKEDNLLIDKVAPQDLLRGISGITHLKHELLAWLRNRPADSGPVSADEVCAFFSEFSHQ